MDTRITSDPSRIYNKLRLNTHAGRYQLDVPGNGLIMPFQDDPFCRLQKFAANIQPNMLDLESELQCRHRPAAPKDAPSAATFVPASRAVALAAAEAALKYPTADPYTEVSRTTQPAWISRNLETTRWDYSLEDPQAHAVCEVPRNLGTRMAEKIDYIKHLVKKSS